MSRLAKFWQGRFPLSKTFLLGWAVPVIGGNVLLFVRPWWLIDFIGPIAFYVAVVLVPIYTVAAVIPVWRSAATFTGHRLLKFGARAVATFFPILIVIAGFIAYKLIGHLFFVDHSSHYRSYIPAAFEIEENVFSDDRMGGFIEGCGVAIFRLSEHTSSNISKSGVAYLNENSIVKEAPRHWNNYQSWNETPPAYERGEYLIFDRVADTEDVTGPNCVNVPTPIKKNILSAIKSPGAYYSKEGRHNELLVIPSLRLVIFSHDR